MQPPVARPREIHRQFLPASSRPRGWKPTRPRVIVVVAVAATLVAGGDLLGVWLTNPPFRPNIYVRDVGGGPACAYSDYDKVDIVTGFIWDFWLGNNGGRSATAVLAFFHNGVNITMHEYSVPSQFFQSETFQASYNSNHEPCFGMNQDAYTVVVVAVTPL